MPSEVISQNGKVIRVRIGKPISVEDQKEFTEIPAFSEFIRKKTYMLANPFEKKSNKILSSQNLKITSPPKKITSQKNVQSFMSMLQKTPKRVVKYFNSSKLDGSS